MLRQRIDLIETKEVRPALTSAYLAEPVRARAQLETRW